ncbi:hypothetical protein GYMC52_2607 [Geobacillus sp. Y412MC52]|nr:hypothetical protein GYMC52_2607 [Geobacillus sp. Y412MC52]
MTAASEKETLAIGVHKGRKMCYNKTNNRPNVFVGSLIVLTEQFMIRELGVSKRRARLFVTGEAQTLEQGTHL